MHCDVRIFVRSVDCALRSLAQSDGYTLDRCRHFELQLQAYAHSRFGVDAIACQIEQRGNLLVFLLLFEEGVMRTMKQQCARESTRTPRPSTQHARREKSRGGREATENAAKKKINNRDREWGSGTTHKQGCTAQAPKRRIPKKVQREAKDECHRHVALIQRWRCCSLKAPMPPPL